MVEAGQGSSVGPLGTNLSVGIHNPVVEKNTVLISGPLRDSQGPVRVHNQK